MSASRQALIEFEKQEIANQATFQKEHGIQLGPWYTIGPFSSPNAYPYGVAFGPETQINLEKTYAGGDLKWIEKPEWADGVVHKLPGHGKSGEGKGVANYVFRNITAAGDITLPVYLGSNDGIQVWLNGQRILANDIGRKAGPDQEIVNLNFKTGVNEFLMKINNRAAGHAFYFSMHPGGGVSVKRYDQLWNLLRRDFTDRTQQDQMKWEQQDKIWARDHKSTYPAALAERYAEATSDLGELRKQAKKLAARAHTPQQVQKVRMLYYQSKSYDLAITTVEEKLRLVETQFNYLRSKFKKNEDDAQWKDYKVRLRALQNAADRLLAKAKNADADAIDALTRMERDLTNLHKSRLPKIPSASQKPACLPFDLKQVRLLDGPFKRAMELDRKYLHDLDSDRLLRMFRITAGLPSSADQLGGWEKRGLRGHTMGHYLSACALMYSSTGDKALKNKADAIVTELGKCQKALGNGYLSAFPEEGIKNIIYRTGEWWAPWYTLHKIFAGLIDMYNHCGNKRALQIAEGMAAWAKSHLDNLNEAQTQLMLKAEFGGMNETLCNLYAVTKDPNHLALAKQFDHQSVFEPLAHFNDQLTGLHSNTTVPKIVGAAREFELTGEPYYYNIATFFWDQVVDARSYCTGGTSHHEHWRTEPYKLAAELSPATQETCCTYNMLKLTRHLFCWNPNARYADYYERALFNSILSTQDPKTGMMMYFVPLASGYWKVFNTPNDSFWCCTGTGLENHAKYGNSIYFHDKDGVFVNLFIASELDWQEKRLRIRQETNFPEQQAATLTINTKKKVKLPIHVRIPYWATKPVTVTINGAKQNIDAQARSYLMLERTWEDGDKIKIDMPMSLHLHKMPDDENLAAIMYGPLVLAGALGSEDMDPNTLYAAYHGVLRNYKVKPAPTLIADAENLESWIKPVAGKPLTFETVNAGKPHDVTLIPYHKLFGQRYAIYWRIQPSETGK